MKTLKIITTLVVLGLLWNCNISPKPIEYGQDACHFCKMTIVDKMHAAEVVTAKGKVYKFDATECMINFLNEFDTSTIALYLSNNFTNPEELIDATQATFLISKNVPSPMGAFLSAFKNKEDAIKLQAKKDGEIYSWESLLKKFED
jgi:copper chaperone NosL